MGKEVEMTPNRREAIEQLEKIVSGLKDGTVGLYGYTPIKMCKSFGVGIAETSLEISYYEESK